MPASRCRSDGSARRRCAVSPTSRPSWAAAPSVSPCGRTSFCPTSRTIASPNCRRASTALGLDTKASGIRGGLVACTGNTGCKFSATDTKGQALLIADYLDKQIALDQPVNIHLTGCPNSCAQHYVGDIGLLGIKVGEDLVDGYTIMVGGGAGSERALARGAVPERADGRGAGAARAHARGLSGAAVRCGRVVPRFHAAPFGRGAEAPVRPARRGGGLARWATRCQSCRTARRSTAPSAPGSMAGSRPISPSARPSRRRFLRSRNFPGMT